MRSFPYVTDLNEWKKKNRLEQGEKVFIITGGYGDLKKALMERFITEDWYMDDDTFVSSVGSYYFILEHYFQIYSLVFDIGVA